MSKKNAVNNTNAANAAAAVRRSAPKSFPSAQLRRCAYRAKVPSMTRPFLDMMERLLNAEAEKLVKRACAYKGDRRMTLTVNDIKRAYAGNVFGAREEKDTPTTQTTQHACKAFAYLQTKYAASDVTREKPSRFVHQFLETFNWYPLGEGTAPLIENATQVKDLVIAETAAASAASVSAEAAALAVTRRNLFELNLFRAFCVLHDELFEAFAESKRVVVLGQNRESRVATATRDFVDAETRKRCYHVYTQFMHHYRCAYHVWYVSVHNNETTQRIKGNSVWQTKLFMFFLDEAERALLPDTIRDEYAAYEEGAEGEGLYYADRVHALTKGEAVDIESYLSKYEREVVVYTNMPVSWVLTDVTKTDIASGMIGFMLDALYARTFERTSQWRLITAADREADDVHTELTTAAASLREIWTTATVAWDSKDEYKRQSVVAYFDSEAGAAHIKTEMLTMLRAMFGVYEEDAQLMYATIERMTVACSCLPDAAFEAKCEIRGLLMGEFRRLAEVCFNTQEGWAMDNMEDFLAAKKDQAVLSRGLLSRLNINAYRGYEDQVPESNAVKTDAEDGDMVVDGTQEARVASWAREIAEANAGDIFEDTTNLDMQGYVMPTPAPLVEHEEGDALMSMPRRYEVKDEDVNVVKIAMGGWQFDKSLEFADYFYVPGDVVAHLKVDEIIRLCNGFVMRTKYLRLDVYNYFHAALADLPLGLKTRWDVVEYAPKWLIEKSREPSYAQNPKQKEMISQAKWLIHVVNMTRVYDFVQTASRGFVTNPTGKMIVPPTIVLLKIQQKTGDFQEVVDARVPISYVDNEWMRVQYRNKSGKTVTGRAPFTVVLHWKWLHMLYVRDFPSAVGVYALWLPSAMRDVKQRELRADATVSFANRFKAFQQLRQFSYLRVNVLVLKKMIEGENMFDHIQELNWLTEEWLPMYLDAVSAEDRSYTSDEKDVAGDVGAWLEAFVGKIANAIDHWGNNVENFVNEVRSQESMSDESKRFARDFLHHQMTTCWKKKDTKEGSRAVAWIMSLQKQDIEMFFKNVFQKTGNDVQKRKWADFKTKLEQTRDGMTWFS